ncbi:DUF3152 domain-containing protein [Nocardiopsis suaedae]|uniref:DUF3152 domain-containing protein n=1 Tax=Nocardiopsis suaedae TaxID=3018444 RepID=A0ABT4TJT3_9ACTN|nr:DUF3152 domain-containing protein [Nocardiopsis suaedae]MDA2804387.1 DUF3152 domain-containing protein [Nocardiopsis suaedae]
MPERAPQSGGRRRRYPPEVLVGLAVVALGCVLLVADNLPWVPDPGAGRGAAVSPSPSPSGGGDARGGPSGSPSPSSPPSPSPSPSPIMRSVVEEVTSADGELETVGGGAGPVGDGPVVRYTVEVEKGLPGEAEDFADAVHAILGDERGWTSKGHSFERVEEGPVDFRVALASPDTVDAMCAPLRTNGYTSCKANGRAIINQNRWVSGVEHFDGDLETYRIYVINHEVGHALGHGHVGCPGQGERAPVMMQQTLRLDGCEPNGWLDP